MADNTDSSWGIALESHGALMYGSNPHNFFITNSFAGSEETPADTLAYYPYPYISDIYDESGCPNYTISYVDRLSLTFYIDFEKGSDVTGNGTADKPWRSFLAADRYFSEAFENNTIQDNKLYCALKRKLCCMSEDDSIRPDDLILIAQCSGVAKDANLFAKYEKFDNGTSCYSGTDRFHVVANLKAEFSDEDLAKLGNCGFSFRILRDSHITWELARTRYHLDWSIFASLIMDSTITAKGTIAWDTTIVDSDIYNCIVTATAEGSEDLIIVDGISVNSTITGKLTVAYTAASTDIDAGFHRRGKILGVGRAYNSTVSVEVVHPSVDITFSREEVQTVNAYYSIGVSAVGTYAGTGSSIQATAEVGNVTVAGISDSDCQYSCEVSIDADASSTVSCNSTVTSSVYIGNLNLATGWSGWLTAYATAHAYADDPSTCTTNATAHNTGGTLTCSGVAGDYGAGTYPVTGGQSEARAYSTGDKGRAAATTGWINLPASPANYYGSRRINEYSDHSDYEYTCEHKYWRCEGDPYLGETVSCSWVTEDCSGGY